MWTQVAYFLNRNHIRYYIVLSDYWLSNKPIHPLNATWLWMGVLPSSHNDMNIITTLLLNALLLHCAQYFEIFGMQYRNVCMIFVSFNVKENRLESLVGKCFSRNQTRLIFRSLGEEILLCYMYALLFYDIMFIILFERLLLVTDGRILFYDPYNQDRKAFCHYIYNAFNTSNYYET